MQLRAVGNQRIVYAHVATDNLQVQWGMQDHYEIVRKVGRGKYSEVRAIKPYRMEQPHLI